MLSNDQMNFYSRWVVRHAGWIVLGAILIAVVGARYSILLYKNLRTDIEELLPSTARSVLDLNEVTTRLESIDSITVLVFSDNPTASRKFIDDLARELDQYPRSTVAWTEYRIDKEIRFFMQRQALFLDLPDLIRIRDYVRDRIHYEISLYNPINIFSENELPEPVFNFLHLKKKFGKDVDYYTQFPDGYYATKDEKIRLLLAYLPGKVSGINGAKLLKQTVLDSVAKLNPTSYAPDLKIAYSGGVQNLLEEHEALLEDLGLSSIIVTVIVTLGMLIYFRSFWSTSALLISLFVGTLATLGCAYHLIGYLNANSAFLGSIIIGNGINFGIIFLARYIEERRKRKGHLRSVTLAIQQTGTATLTAALAAAFAYGSLMLTDFRGFRQFGIIGFVGMSLCWISAYLVLPALLTMISKLKLIERRQWPQPRRLFSALFARVIQHGYAGILIFSVLLSIGSIFMFHKFDKNILETDLLKLRSKRSIESGSIYYAQFADQVFQRYMTPIVFLPHSEEDALKIRAALAVKREEEGSRSLIDVLSHMNDFVPAHQEEKIKILREIQGLFTPRVMASVSEHEKKMVGRYLTPEVFHPFTRADLPAVLLNRFREKDGTLGKLVLVEPPLSPDTRDADRLLAFISDLRQVADAVQPKTPVAGQLVVSADMLQAIRKDGPAATVFAFFAVIVLIVILFRSIKISGYVLGSLLLGVLWMFGVILAFDLKINFLNFIALPMTFGIGVDYAVNIFQRYRLEGQGQVIKTVRETGSAVALASFTTVVGYASLIIASNQAFVSFGTLSILGEVTCLFTALFTIPALLHFIDLRHRREKKLA